MPTNTLRDTLCKSAQPGDCRAPGKLLPLQASRAALQASRAALQQAGSTSGRAQYAGTRLIPAGRTGSAGNPYGQAYSSPPFTCFKQNVLNRPLRRVPIENVFIDRVSSNDVVNEDGALQSRLHLPHWADPFDNLHPLAQGPVVAEEDDVVASVLEAVNSMSSALGVEKQHRDLARLEVVLVLLRLQHPTFGELLNQAREVGLELVAYH